MTIFLDKSSTCGRVLRPRQQWERMGIARSTYYSIRKSDPNFPRQFPLTSGGRAVGTFEGDFEAYLRAKAAQNDGGRHS